MAVVLPVVVVVVEFLVVLSELVAWLVVVVEVLLVKVVVVPLVSALVAVLLLGVAGFLAVSVVVLHSRICVLSFILRLAFGKQVRVYGPWPSDLP